MFCEGPIETKVQVTHEEVDVCDGIRLDHVFLAEQTYIFEYALGHRQTLFHSVLTRFKMTIDEAESRVIQRELDHDSTFPPVAYHILHYVVLTCVAHEPAVVLLNEND